MIQLPTNCGRGTRGTGTALPSRVAGRSGTCTSPPIAGAIRRGRTRFGRSPDSPTGRSIHRSSVPLAIPSCFRITTPIARLNRSHRYSEARSPSAVDQVRPGAWQGPIESGLGWHLVFVSSATPGRTPSYDEVEGEIKRGWIDEQRALARQRAFDAMKSHYEVHLPKARIAAIARKLETGSAP